MSRSRSGERAVGGGRRVDRGGLRASRLIVLYALLGVLCSLSSTLRAQSADTTAFYRALELESAGKYKDAAPLFRTALNTTSAVSALLGLERVYAELGWSDSLLPPLDALIKRNPHESVYRSVQLRTLQSLGREEQLHAAIDRWIRDVPGDPTPSLAYP